MRLSLDLAERLQYHRFLMPNSSKSLHKILLSGAALFLFFFLLGRIPLWSSDEGRFGEIAREMLESKNFIIPQFNYVPYLDKPILAPLLTCVMYALFGVTDFATRLVPVLSALLGLFFFHRFSKRIFNDRTADFAALLLLTTVGYVLVGRFAVIDMLMTFFISTTLFCLFLAFYEKNSHLYLAAYALMGLGFLTKGLIGIVLPGFIFFLFLLWTRNLPEIKKMRLLPGTLILAAIILPWFLSAMKKKSDFFHVFILEQHFKRFSTGSFGRRRPFWFFIPILLGLGIPWTLFLPAATFHGLKQKGPERMKAQFLLCWAAGILIFFSIPKSKLPYYILPATMPIALLVGNFFSRITLHPEEIPRKFLSWTWKLFPLTAAAALFGFNGYLLFFAAGQDFLQLKTLGLIGTTFAASGFLFAYFAQKKNLAHGVIYLAGTVYAALLVTILGMQILSPIQSTMEEAEDLGSILKPGDQVAVYASPDRFSDLPFHLRRRVMIAGSNTGTLGAQMMRLPRKERDTYFIDSGELVRRLNTPRERIVCLLDEKWLPDLIGYGLKEYRVLRKEHGKILIANF